MNKKWISLLLAAVMTGCTAAGNTEAAKEEAEQAELAQEATVSEESDQSENEKFETYINEYVIGLCQESYTTAHLYFTDPEKYGIDLSQCDYTLGDFVSTQEELKELDEVLDTLNSFDTSKLSLTNRQLWEQIYWQNDLSKRLSDSRFTYLGSIWSEMDGVPSTLVTYFSEYRLDSEDGIEPLIKLIEDVPNYVQKALDYSKEQAKLGYLQLDLDTVTATCQDVLDSQEDSIVTSELEAEVEALMLSESETKEYISRISKALDTSFFPAFQTMIDGLNDLKSDIKPITGLASLSKDGQDYYQLLLEYYTGTDTSASAIQSQMAKTLSALSSSYSKISRSNPKAVQKADDLSTGFESISDIMPFLEENYSKAFPVLETMNYEIKPLSDEQSQQGVVAYFVNAPVDSTRPYEIRYNARDYGDDPQSLSLYETMAHEGIPGHMYQDQYNREHYTQLAQYFQNCLGMQEGYASYVQTIADQWLDLDADALSVYQMNDEYTDYLVLFLDVEINYNGMSLNEFIQTYGEGLDDLYYQLAENPGTFMAYYYGRYLIENLEEEARSSLKDDFSLVDFNNALLQAGTVKYSIIEENVQNYIDMALNGA